MTVGDRIKNKRIELGLTQEELAQRMGYKGRTSVCVVETGEDNITLTKVKKFADALGVTPGHLMGWDAEDSEEVAVVAPIVPVDAMEKERAIKLFEMYSHADPDIQKAVDLLLKSSQQNPSSVD